MTNTTDTMQPIEIVAKEALQALYHTAAIETVHVVTDCAEFYFAAQRNGPRGDWDEIVMPPGNYIIAKIVERPTSQAGVFGVKAPREPNQAPDPRDP